MVVATAVFCFFVGRFYIPGQGFTALICFGDAYEERRLPEITRDIVYVVPQSTGYDAQWYAQVAVRPDLRSPEVAASVDNLPYRARRILFPIAAHLLGGGVPDRVLGAYALQNVVSWFLLGLVLLHWLPPRDWGNTLRWLAILFSFGLAFSVRNALVDGPALLLLACGMLLLEKGRDWWAALLLGLAGLGKETTILAGAALVRGPLRTIADWRRLLLCLGLVVLPLALWLVYLTHLFGLGSGEIGARNFAPPFVEFWHKIAGSLGSLDQFPSSLIDEFENLCLVISLAVQVLFFALRPRWQQPWWRIGAVFSVLVAVLGEAVWEGYPAAIARVVLPLTLAFNLTLPRGPRWWPVFVLGNLTLLCAPTFTRLPLGIERSAIEAPKALLASATTAQRIEVRYVGPWHLAEHSVFESWHWTNGSVELEVVNPHSFPLEADLTFGLNSRDHRTVAVRFGEATLWSGPSDPVRRDVAIRRIRLLPGTNRIGFLSDTPPVPPTMKRDTRPLAFRIYDLKLRIGNAAPAS